MEVVESIKLNCDGVKLETPKSIILPVSFNIETAAESQLDALVD